MPTKYYVKQWNLTENTMSNVLITALATPYKDGKIDKLSYERLVNYQIQQGVDALLAIGTTAEAQLLNNCEKRLLLSIAKYVACDTPVYAGIEGRSTADAVKEAETMQKFGANGLLVAPPAFVKCTPLGYLRHVEQILQVVSVPLILYNAPTRCGYVLDGDVVEQLSDRVRYLKDAGSDLHYTERLAQNMTVWCGNDQLLPQFVEHGATGVISVTSNVAPQLTRCVLDGQQSKLFADLSALTMAEVSPICIKYMLYKKGIFDSYEMRLPLTEASAESRNKIDEIWSEEIK